VEWLKASDSILSSKQSVGDPFLLIIHVRTPSNSFMSF
jgi:hypothetical protein